jgi:hypothetical protein
LRPFKFAELAPTLHSHRAFAHLAEISLLANDRFVPRTDSCTAAKTSRILSETLRLASRDAFSRAYIQCRLPPLECD